MVAAIACQSTFTAPHTLQATHNDRDDGQDPRHTQTTLFLASGEALWESPWPSLILAAYCLQATVLLLVPYETTKEDVVVVIERDYLLAGVRGQQPVVKGRLYGTVDVTNSAWQLEPRNARLSARERTTSTISTTSTQSSYAFVSDPEISSSFAASLESGQTSDAEEVVTVSPGLASPVSSGDERSGPTYQA
ncbi:hypothetical protein J3R82DRAFT_11918 [Butyriboletus roseoflavus]|nr:hypothetical protein J3R82DRAFT_11918 [Butyriboletus roseoflavus]